MSKTGLNKESALNDIVAYWKESSKKHAPQEFIGQLSLLKEPLLDNGPYSLVSAPVEARMFINTNVARDWYTPSSAVKTELRFFDTICEPMIVKNDIVFDCGAHHGLYSVLFAKEVGEKGKVVAFELVPINADLAQINVDINGLSNNVEVIAAGVSSENKTILSSPQAHSMKESKTTDSVSMQLVTLDTYIHENPTVIKMDIEGSEVNALMGATELLKRKIKWFISVHPPFIKEFGHNPKEIFDYLKLEDYNCYIKYPEKEASEYHGEYELETFCDLLFFPKQNK